MKGALKSYQIQQTVSVKLSWSHYYKLLTISAPDKRSFYETDKDSIAAEYALGGLSNNIFASRYVSYIPNKEQLIAQVEAVLNERHKPENEHA